MSPAVAALLMFPQLAMANGVLRWGFGAEDLGAAGAFGGTSGDVITAMQVNPALLSTFKENRWVISARYLSGDAAFRRDGITSRLGGAEGVYPDLALAWRLPDSPLSFGFGLSPISALEARWNYLDAPGGIGDISYGTVDHESRFTAVRLALAMSWQVNDRLSLGLSAGTVRSEIDLNAPFIFQSNPDLLNAKVNLNMETHGWAPSVEFGAHYRPNNEWSFGGRVKLPVALDNRGKAEVDFSSQVPTFTNARYEARARNELPLTLGAGAHWQATDRWAVGVWVDWHQWSQSYDTFKVDLSDGSDPLINAGIGDSPSDRVPLDWKDRFVFSVGTSYEINQEWTLRGGYRFGKSPVPETLVTPLNAAILEHAFTVGLSWQRDDWQLDFAYGYEFSGTSRINESGYRTGEYSDSSLEADVQHLSIGIGRKF